MQRSKLGRRVGTVLLLATIAVTIALGIHGNHVDSVQSGTKPPGWDVRYIADLLFRTVQLFVIQLNPRSMARVPVTLEIARWLGAIVAGVALVRAGAEIFKNQIEERRLRLVRGHVIVCGLGRKGFHLVRQLCQRGDRVVVVEIDEGDDELATLRTLGVPVLIGDATSTIFLQKAGVARASRVVAVCRDDSVNIEIALQARKIALAARREATHPLICHVHIIDLRLAELFRQHSVFACTSDPFEARIFSFYENSARDLLTRYPLDQPPAAGDAGRTGVHLVIVGFGQMGESIALQAARIGHFASGQRLRITVLDPRANERRLNLMSRYPQIEKVVDFDFGVESVEHPLVRGELARWATSPTERLVVAICLDDDPLALSITLNLPKALQAARTPIYVRQSEQRGLAALLDGHSQNVAGGWNVAAFGEPEVAAGLEQILQEKLDALARAIHERYISHRQADPSGPAGDPATLPWQQLDSGLKASNRQQADHIDVKLRAIGCRRLPARDRSRASRRTRSSCLPAWSTIAGAPTATSPAGNTATWPTSPTRSATTWSPTSSLPKRSSSTTARPCCKFPSWSPSSASGSCGWPRAEVIL
jgi:voltage-gated potassium channel Kch